MFSFTSDLANSLKIQYLRRGVIYVHVTQNEQENCLEGPASVPRRTGGNINPVRLWKRVHRRLHY